MCRLYGHYSNHLERVSCELLDSQNSLIKQSVEDGRGLANPHGWGLGYQKNGQLQCRRQVGPASKDEAFRKAAAGIESHTVIAHVRRATVGEPKHENTHPFLFENSMLAHNGHIEAFFDLRDEMLNSMPPEHRDGILGKTDSEHIFHLLLSERQRNPDKPPSKVMAETIRKLAEWNEASARCGELALNLLWVADDELLATRLDRSLYYIEREEPHECEVCGDNHIVEELSGDYYSVEIASEPITDEDWTEIENGSIVSLGSPPDVSITPLFD